MSHYPEAPQQHVNVEENERPNNEVSLLQLNELNMSSESESESDDSYCFNFNFYQKLMCMANEDASNGKSRKRYEKSILLDTGLSFSCINNSNLIVKLRKSKKPINGISNGGTLLINME